jgi:hypothetical protein
VLKVFAVRVWLRCGAMLRGYFLVSLHYLTNDKLHQFLDKNRIQTGMLCKFRQAIVLMLFPLLIHCWQMVFSFQYAHLISAAKTFCKHMDERGVDIVNGLSKG